MVRQLNSRFFFFTSNRIPVGISIKLKDNPVYNNISKNSKNTLQNKDHLKYYNQNYNIKHGVNWIFEW